MLWIFWRKKWLIFLAVLLIKSFIVFKKHFFVLKFINDLRPSVMGKYEVSCYILQKEFVKKKCESNCGCNGNRTNWSKQRIPMRHRPHLAHRCDWPPLLSGRSTVHVQPVPLCVDCVLPERIEFISRKLSLVSFLCCYNPKFESVQSNLLWLEFSSCWLVFIKFV